MDSSDVKPMVPCWRSSSSCPPSGKGEAGQLHVEEEAGGFASTRPPPPPPQGREIRELDLLYQLEGRPPPPPPEVPPPDCTLSLGISFDSPAATKTSDLLLLFGKCDDPAATNVAAGGSLSDMPNIDPVVACSRSGLRKTYCTGSNLQVCSQADHRVDLIFDTQYQLEEGEFKPVMNAWWHSALKPRYQKHGHEIDCRSNDGARTVKKTHAWVPTAENDELSDETQ